MHRRLKRPREGRNCRRERKIGGVKKGNAAVIRAKFRKLLEKSST